MMDIEIAGQIDAALGAKAKALAAKAKTRGAKSAAGRKAIVPSAIKTQALIGELGSLRAGGDKLSASWVLVIGSLFLGYYWWKIRKPPKKDAKDVHHLGPVQPSLVGAALGVEPGASPYSKQSALPGGGPPTEQQVRDVEAADKLLREGGSRRSGTIAPILSPVQRGSISVPGIAPGAPFDFEAQLSREVS